MSTARLQEVIHLFLSIEGTEEAADFLARETELLLSDESVATLETIITAEVSPKKREFLAQRLELIRSVRSLFQSSTVSDAAAVAQSLANQLVAWIQTADWQASEEFLHTNADELLTDAGETTLQLLLQANPGNSSIETHIVLLRSCRQKGIDAAYTELRQAMESGELLRNNPLLQLVIQFLQSENDKATEEFLRENSRQLLTNDVRPMIDGFLQASQQQNDSALYIRFQQRQQQWRRAMQQRATGPLRRRDGDDNNLDNSPQQREWQEQPQSVVNSALDRTNRYVVVSARNSAIGDGASVLNIFNVGELPLQWRRPLEIRVDLTRNAVGREAELAELHQRLQQQQGMALVSKGTMAAVRGQPGIGKTTLAAMYAEHFSDHYPGGIFWLEVGPGRRNGDSVTPILQRMVTYAYNADAQALQLLENCIFAGETVRTLLSGHGALLVVIDDVWSEEVITTLKSAMPTDASLLLTTRDYDVAFALEGRESAIQRLDVLSAEDAQLLIERTVPDLPKELRKRLAQGLGYHAQALTLATAALARRKAARYEQTVTEILTRVKQGRGFGDLPRMEKAERLSEVEIALKYSYDYLGEGAAGTRQQFWLRSLGIFAQESSFDSEALASLWQCSQEEADEGALLLEGLALLQEVQAAESNDTRWQQHAILRAYALSLQEASERIFLPERHADHYLALAERCYRAKPRNNERVEIEFKQIEHAFAWCTTFSPLRATQFTNLLNDFMRNRGRSVLLNEWLQLALDAASQSGNQAGKANTLKSLGDLERRLGNVEAARTHYDAALPLYEAEQARLGKANTLQSLGDLESRLGNVEAARTHYDAALPLYEAEQARLGKANTLQSLGDLESRLGNVEAARTHYDAALPLYEAEQARLGKANTLKSLGDLESRLGNVEAARTHYDAALPLYEAEQARLGKANTLQSLGDLESRLGNVEAARTHYDAALPLYEAEQARLGKANTLKSLGDLESRLGNVEAARTHYDAALPLYEAEQARLGKANTLQSLGDLERRLGNVEAARTHYDAALPLYEAEQARLGKANTLQSLGDLERRLGNVEAARTHYDAALPLYEAEQARLGKANTLQSLGDLESRLGNVEAARTHYDAALPLYEAEQARLGKANTLQSLGDLESRLGNVEAARTHYDAALPLYEAEQARLGKANTLKSLGDLESRLGNVEAARTHYDAALPLYEAEQARLGKANTLQSLGDLESRLGNVEAARTHYDAALRFYQIEQEAGGIINTLVSIARLEAALGNIAQSKQNYQQAFAVADSSGFADHPVVQGMRSELAALDSSVPTSPEERAMQMAQALAEQLVEWIKTPDWQSSQRHLAEQQELLVNEAAVTVLQMLLQANNGNQTIAQHITLLQRCLEIGIEAAYQEVAA